MGKISLENLRRRITTVNKSLHDFGVKDRKLELGQRYSRKYLDVVDMKGRTMGDALAAGTSGEVYEYLHGMLSVFRLISDAKYRRER